MPAAEKSTASECSQNGTPRKKCDLAAGDQGSGVEVLRRGHGGAALELSALEQASMANLKKSMCGWLKIKSQETAGVHIPSICHVWPLFEHPTSQGCSRNLRGSISKDRLAETSERGRTGL